MRYYVIHKGESPVAVVFHDYVEAGFVVRSNSESFLKAFDAAVSLNSSYTFNKSDSNLKFSIFGSHFPSWIDKVLQKACGDFWTVESTGNLAGDAFIEDIIQKFLPKL